ncbi:hypothetical protein [Actinoplanes rectilineatus]|uniref:hypothetical protein n=1 Tax=Actinoplanes rectilineatus TaxID=113571 RepID=UPI000AB7B217|nr:hypothetical protein [Actinoplanes rectilineatus]
MTDVIHSGSALMPFHNQGTARSPERRAVLTGHRWVLRVLVVGGLAGAAWLLTGTTAQAADPAGVPVGAVAEMPGSEPAAGEPRPTSSVADLWAVSVSPQAGGNTVDEAPPVTAGAGARPVATPSGETPRAGAAEDGETLRIGHAAVLPRADTASRLPGAIDAGPRRHHVAAPAVPPD